MEQPRTRAPNPSVLARGEIRLGAAGGPATALGRATSAGAPKTQRCCIVIGVSTGGPSALTRLFRDLVPPLPPVVVVQHMPSPFTAALARRLDGLSILTVKEAAAGDWLRPNCAYVAPGDWHVVVRGAGGQGRIMLRDTEPVSGHRPSIDVAMHSAAAVYGAGCLGVIMTGMGRDGVEGCRAIKTAGGYVLGQDEATSDVYGMNHVAFREGWVDRQFALDHAAREIAAWSELREVRV